MAKRKPQSQEQRRTLEPSGISGTLHRGFEQLRSGDHQAAAEVADQVLRVAPTHHGAFNLSGLAAMERGEASKAIEQFQEAARLGPKVANYRVNLAVACRRAHRHEEAAAACEQAIELRPDYVLAHLNLGAARFSLEQFVEALSAFQRGLQHAASGSNDRAVLLAYRGDAERELGRLQAAMASYRAALDISPDLSHAIGNLGLTLLGVGQPEVAVEHAERAVQLDANSSGPWMNLGATLRALDRLDDAMEAYGKAFDLDPESAELACQIASVWLEVGDVAQAIQWCEKALKSEPDRIEAVCGIAAALLEAGDSAAAVERYRAVVSDHDSHADAWLGLGRALWSDGDAEGAIQACRRAVELRPEHAGSLAQLATILASAGDVDSANDTNREALRVNPRCIPALSNLAQNLRGRLEAREVTQLEGLLKAPWVRDGGRASLHFGLAHYRDGLGEFAAAAQHASDANGYHTKHKAQRGWSYDPAEYEQFVTQLIDTFTPTYFDRTSGVGNTSKQPVFIVGMPRSGTTLTEQIIASHPRAFGAGERNFASRAFCRIPQLLDRPGQSPIDCVAEVSSPAVETLAGWHLGQLRQVVEQAGLVPDDVESVLDKMPENYSLLGWIVAMFPRARIIHCRRDVRDVAVSCWTTQFKEIRWAFDVDHIAHRILQYQRLMEHWRRALPTQILEIDYEETVADTPSQTRKLLDYVGLPWDDVCLRFHETERLVRTASVTQVRQPIYRRSIDRWRRYEGPLGDLFERIGHSRHGSKDPSQSG